MVVAARGQGRERVEGGVSRYLFSSLVKLLACFFIS